MTISATELFERYASRNEERGFRREPPWFERRAPEGQGEPVHEQRVRVSGTVVKTLLGADKAARIVLSADERGLATVICRCISDEVLWEVAPGDEIALEGVVRGLEDSLTLVVELCEVVSPRTQRASFLHILPGGRERAPKGVEASRCDFCGKVESRPLTICRECAAKCPSLPKT